MGRAWWSIASNYKWPTRLLGKDSRSRMSGVEKPFRFLVMISEIVEEDKTKNFLDVIFAVARGSAKNPIGLPSKSLTWPLDLEFDRSIAQHVLLSSRLSNWIMCQIWLWPNPSLSSTFRALCLVPAKGVDPSYRDFGYEEKNEIGKSAASAERC